MPNSGRMVIDADGTILEADDNFAAMMRAAHSQIGVNALDITAPGDRDRCKLLVARIVDDGAPLVTTKRLIRADGSGIWVRNRLESIGTPAMPRIAITIEKTSPPAGWVEPDELLRIARQVFGARRSRTAAFGIDFFTDHAWDLLIAAYICEAEGSVITIARLHAWTGISLATGSRWIRALTTEGLLECENGGNSALVTTPFCLTAAAHQKFESYLSDLYEKAATHDRVALSRG